MRCLRGRTGAADAHEATARGRQSRGRPSRGARRTAGSAPPPGYTPEQTRIWLYARHPLLEGRRAIDLIHAGEADKVLVVIESLEDGTYT